MMRIGIQINTLEVNAETPLSEEQINIIRRLKEKGHDIVIVLNMKEYEGELTCLNKAGKYIEEVIKQFLIDNEVPFDDIISTLDTQRDICVNNGINYLVKDQLNEETFESISKLTGYASIDKPWLQYYNEEQINVNFPKMTVYDYLKTNNKLNMSQVAIEYLGNSITYSQLFNLIDKTINMLLSLGIGKGDVISICSITTPEVIALFYAASQVGAVINVIDPRTNSNGIKSYLNECNSKYLFALEMISPKIDTFVDETNIEKVITFSPSDSASLLISLLLSVKKVFTKNSTSIVNNLYVKYYDLIRESSSLKNNKYTYEKDTPLVMVHTGGTTGIPKGVLLSNDSLNIVAYQYRYSGLNIKDHDTFLDIMPPFIGYGLGVGMHMPLTSGMKLVVMPLFNPNKFDDLILKYKPNHMAVVPSYWRNVVNSKKMIGKDLSFLVTPGVGGDGMDPEVERETTDFLLSHGAPNPIVKGYGMTEFSSAGVICINKANKFQSSGIALPSNNMSIFIPGTDKELSYNEVGEICLSTPTTMLGYYQNVIETNKVIIKHLDGESWVHSQDLGYMDQDGLLFVEGRIKRMIVRQDGFKIFPPTIESVIKSHYAVESCMVVGIPDNDYSQGELPKAHIVLKKQYYGYEDSILLEIQELCRKELAEYAQPVSYKFRDSIPVTSIGKADYIALMNEDKENCVKKLQLSN